MLILYENAWRTLSDRTALLQNPQDLIDFQAEEIKGFDPLSPTIIVTPPPLAERFPQEENRTANGNSRTAFGRGVESEICSKPKHY